MDPFFTYVTIAALVILIVILILVGISMSNLQSAMVFPPTRSACPDYWDVSSNPQYCGIPTNSTMRNLGFIKTETTGSPAPYNNVDVLQKQNVGLCTGAGFGCKSGTNGETYLELVRPPTRTSDFQYAKLNNNTNWGVLYPGLSEVCAKKRWASTMNITWDGVSNYTGC
jgi:hypothetical protein